MARVRFDRVTRRFGRTAAVDGVSLDVRPGEFLALLGPSGCGKTTLLRLIAGFETPDEGAIHLGDRLVGSPAGAVPPEERGLAMVFQSYALWPHMSVAENVAFSLKVRRIAARERAARVEDALAAVGLEGMASRRPHELSGGQRQRVALARCLAMRPGVVLLDEPLANLDMHLRETMQREFRRFHADSSATFVYVTHDQAEAMSLADRVAVMDRGRLQQVGPPRSLYREPETEMVARFIGRGMVVPVEVIRTSGDTALASFGGHRFEARCRRGAVGDRACLRAENLALVPTAEGLGGRVTDLSYQGASTTVTVAVEPCDGSEAVELRLLYAETPPAVGDRVGVRVKDAWLLPPAEGNSAGGAGA